MKPLMTAVTLAIAAGLGLAVPQAALAQSEGQQQQAADYSDATLTSFVAAQEKIRTIMDDYAPKMQAAESEADRKELEKTVNDEIVAAVKATDGITLDRYVEIARAAREDKALYDRIVAMMQPS